MDKIDLLKCCPNQQFYVLIHEIIDQICGSRAPKLDDYVPNVWTSEQHFEVVCDSLRSLLRTAIDVRNKRDIHIDLTEEHQKTLLECLEVRRLELKDAIINETIGHHNHVLQDFNWKLKVVLASDKITNINEPLLSLDLKIKNASTDKRNNSNSVSLELNRQDLNEVLSSLEEAQQSLKRKYL